MQAYMVHLIALIDPIKYLLSKPVLSGWLARWGLLLTEYEIIYIPQKVIRGQAFADFLANHLIPVAWEISDDLPNEDIFYVESFSFVDDVLRWVSMLWWNNCECCICLTTKIDTTCRPSILFLDTGIYPSGVTSTHRSHMAPLGPLLGLVGVRASCGFVCGPLWCICGSFWRVTMAIFLVVHITL